MGNRISPLDLLEVWGDEVANKGFEAVPEDPVSETEDPPSLLTL